MKYFGKLKMCSLFSCGYRLIFWMLFGFAIICFSLGIFIAWYEYKQCNGIQPLIPDYQYRKIMEILNEDKENK